MLTVIYPSVNLKYISTLPWGTLCLIHYSDKIVVLNERETWEKHCAYYWKSRAILYVTRHKVQTWGRKAIYAVQRKAQAKIPRENSQLIAKQYAKSLYRETGHQNLRPG